MGHVRILGTEPGITFAWIIHLRPGVKIRSGVGPILSVVSVVASGISRGLVVQSGDWSSRKDGCRSGRAGFERGSIRDTARIQRGFIGDRYALQSERVIFYPIIPDQAIKIGREWAGVGRASGVNVALCTMNSEFVGNNYNGGCYITYLKCSQQNVSLSKMFPLGERLSW